MIKIKLAFQLYRGYGAKGELRIDISGLGGRVHIRHEQIPVVQADLEHLVSLNIRDVDDILQAHDQGLLVLMTLLHDADVKAATQVIAYLSETL
ncbi:MAG: hypothetical protein FRX49_12846 [Trebouxia sp. A1-2]|nr:MAG: hypothetical protein FRX49_12846 [Trebouxia sp. A1-2]